MKQVLNLLNVKKGPQNSAVTAVSVFGLIYVLLEMDGVTPDLKFGLGILCAVLCLVILGMNLVAQRHNANGTPANVPYDPEADE